MTSEPPLAGVRVVEFLGLGPAPFASMLLADMGAEVLAVARPGTPRPALADNRPVQEIDLKSADGLALARRLVAAADVLVEGFRPGVLERAGLGPDVAAELNPRLVYARMTGWGQHGPLAPRAGHDLTYIAVTGALHHGTRAGGTPTPTANLLGDFGAGGMYLVTSVLAALLRRERTGRGDVLDVAIVDGTTYLTAMLHEYRLRGTWSDAAGTNRLDTGAPYYDVYPCADGRHVAIGALEPQFFAELVGVLGLDDGWPQLRDDPQHWPRLRAEMAAVLLTRTRDEWAAAAEGTDACLAPVLNLAEAAAYPHLLARGVLAEQGPGWRPVLPGLDRPSVEDPADLMGRWGVERSPAGARSGSL